MSHAHSASQKAPTFRLWLMMVLEFAIWGAWLPLIWGYMGAGVADGGLGDLHLFAGQVKIAGHAALDDGRRVERPQPRRRRRRPGRAGRPVGLARPAPHRTVPYPTATSRG